MPAMHRVWLDGTMIEESGARVSIRDHGLTVGDAVFTTMRTERRNGVEVPFAISRHLRRIRRNLAGLGLHLERDDDELRGALHDVAAQFDGPARIRLTVTGGDGPYGSGRGDGPLTAIVAGAPSVPRPPVGTAITVPWRRNEHSAVAGLKTTSYAENVVALAAATEAGAGEALLANTAGQLCEGTGSNVFVVIDGEVVTPPLSSGCLAGVTRELVCEVTDVTERDLPFDVLTSADEVFLTSSTRDVQGQAQVDDRRLRAPGPITAAVADAFAALVARTVDP